MAIRNVPAAQARSGQDNDASIEIAIKAGSAGHVAVRRFMEHSLAAQPR